MTIGTDVIQGILKLNNFMEGKCFTCWSDFVAAVPSMFSVELPSNVSNVNVSSSEPSDSERDHLWVKISPSGSPIGLFIYSQGAWKQFLPAVNQLFYVYGDSNNIPDGYTLASNDPNLSSSEILTLQKTWHPNNAGTGYTIFHVTYTGF